VSKQAHQATSSCTASASTSQSSFPTSSTTAAIPITAPVAPPASTYPLTILVVLAAIQALIRSAAAHTPRRRLLHHSRASSCSPRPPRRRRRETRICPAPSRDCWTTPLPCDTAAPNTLPYMPSAAGAHVQEKKTSPARTPSYLRSAPPTSPTPAANRARPVRTVALSSPLLPGDGRWFQPVPDRRPVSLPEPARQESALPPQRLAN
jgi:hypothetical protein